MTALLTIFELGIVSSQWGNGTKKPAISRGEGRLKFKCLVNGCHVHTPSYKKYPNPWPYYSILSVIDMYVNVTCKLHIIREVQLPIITIIRNG